MNEARERFVRWLQADNPRCGNEWSKWDGTIAHGGQINDRICLRIDAAKRRLDAPYGLMTDAEIARIV
jgi:hypothetical protein